MKSIQLNLIKISIIKSLLIFSKKMDKKIASERILVHTPKITSSEFVIFNILNF